MLNIPHNIHSALFSVIGQYISGTVYNNCMFIPLNLAIAVFQAAFGPGFGPVFLTNVRCTGIEPSLLSCSHIGIGGRLYCSHSSGAGVVCPSSKSLHKVRKCFN